MVPWDWIAAAARFVRANPRRAAVAAATSAALIVGIWLWGSQAVPRSPPRSEPAREAAREQPDPASSAAIITTRPEVKVGDELCGYGPLPLRDGIPYVPEDIETAAAAAFTHIADDLAARSDDRDRALGLHLQALGAGNAAADAWVRDHGKCADGDEACSSAMSAAAAAAAAAGQSALARLASTTSDPEVYALAMQSCVVSSAGDCALLSYAQWARIEPDNAVPWLYLAAEAQGRHDGSGLQAAIARAAAARYSNNYWESESRLVASDTFAAQPEPIQVLLTVQLIGVQAAYALPPIQVIGQYCRAPMQADAEVCTNLASLLIAHSRTAIEIYLGGRIAERLGWTDPRVSILRDEVDALRWQLAQPVDPSTNTVSSCESLQRFRRDMRTRARSGEADLLRRRLLESGVSVSEAAKQWRLEQSRKADRAAPAQ